MRFGKPRFRHRAEHLLRGLGRGELRHHIGVFKLQKPYPAGAARGEERPPELPRMLHFIEKLAALLHDREVGGKVRVKDIVGTRGAERRRHAPFGGELLGKAQPLAPRGAHRRSDLQHDDLLRIVDRGDDLFGIVPLAESAGRTVSDALPAVGAVHLVELFAAAHADGGAAAGAEKVPHAHTLDLLAHGDAAEALHALRRRADDRELRVPVVDRELRLVGVLDDVHIRGELLQRAVAAADAGSAVAVVLRENELHVVAPRYERAQRVRIDLHALGADRVARRHKAVGALDLHHAHAAGRDLAHMLQIAERRDRNAELTRRVENGGAVLHRDGPIVDAKIYHLSFLPPRNAP